MRSRFKRDRRADALAQLLHDLTIQAGHPVSVGLMEACYLLSTHPEYDVLDICRPTEGAKTPQETLARDLAYFYPSRFSRASGQRVYWVPQAGATADTTTRPRLYLLPEGERAAFAAFARHCSCKRRRGR